MKGNYGDRPDSSNERMPKSMGLYKKIRDTCQKRAHNDDYVKRLQGELKKIRSKLNELLIEYGKEEFGVEIKFCHDVKDNEVKKIVNKIYVDERLMQSEAGRMESVLQAITIHYEAEICVDVGEGKLIIIGLVVASFTGKPKVGALRSRHKRKARFILKEAGIEILVPRLKPKV